MTTWTKEYIHKGKYAWVSNNQHGDRFKRCGIKRLSVARMTVENDDAAGLRTLVLLSDYLDVPVRYDFSTTPQTAYIEVVSREAVDDV